MRKILIYLLCLLFFSGQAFGFGLTGKTGGGMRLVASGTSTAANTQLSLVDGTAFAYLVGVDLSAYQTGKHLLMVYNASTGLLIGQGYCSATPPAGETLSGTELLANPSFDSNTTGWTSTNGTVASIAGGQSNNCLELTMTGGTSQIARSALSLTIGKLYKTSSYIKSGTSGNENCKLYVYDGTTTLLLNDSTSSGSWVQNISYFCSGATTSGGELQLRKATATAGTMLFDEAGVKQKTDCETTGTRIINAKGMGTQNWLVKGTGAVNAAISYKVYYVGD